MVLERPAYLSLHRSGELRQRAERAVQQLQHCELCPRACGADRLADEQGTCGVGRRARLASVGPHMGEEAPLRGWRGSGTIFFTGCNLDCLACQNAHISHGAPGQAVDAAELAASMLQLQQRGCHNVNLVTPTHVTAQILEALPLAVEAGLSLPLVYNCGGYEAPATLELLRGVVDIYMPDLKLADDQVGRELCRVPDYATVARAAVRQMHTQVGLLRCDADGVARRGVLLRHLVLPDGLAGTERVMRFVARELSPESYVNLMDQYCPCRFAARHPRLRRPLRREEFLQAEAQALAAGLTRLDHLQ